MPFYKLDIDHMNQSVAQADCADSQDGRLVVYQVDSTDEVARITNRGGSDSQLVVAATIQSLPGNKACTYGTPDFSSHYAYRQLSQDINRAQLQYQVKPYIATYMRNEFNSVDGPFDTWLSELDRAIAHAPVDQYGVMLLSLDLNLAPVDIAGWLQAPAHEKSPQYMNMSMDLQRELKRIIPFYYFADVNKYKDADPAYVLLAYASFPPSTSVRADDPNLLPTNQQVYWDWMDASLRRDMLYSAATQRNLVITLSAVQQRLQASGMQKVVGFYAQDGGTLGGLTRDQSARHTCGTPAWVS